MQAPMTSQNLPRSLLQFLLLVSQLMKRGVVPQRGKTVRKMQVTKRAEVCYPLSCDQMHL